MGKRLVRLIFLLVFLLSGCDDETNSVDEERNGLLNRLGELNKLLKDPTLSPQKRSDYEREKLRDQQRLAELLTPQPPTP